MNILYIEDNPLNFRLVQKKLKGSHSVKGALTGLAGLERAKELMPNLILLDMNLPDIDGFKVCRLLRADNRLKHIPVIALTANAMHGDRERILEAGFNGYIAKPVSRIELKNTISRYEGYAAV